jgi:tetratricopeptide (TPR) repeat protein
MRWAALVIVLAIPVEAADNKALAREVFSDGMRQYDLGDYKTALELFKKAYLNYPEPAIIFNIAQCERQLGHKAEAVRLYRSFLRKVPDAPNRTNIESIIKRLENEMVQEEATKNTAPSGTITPPEKPVQPPPVVVHTEPKPTVPVYKKWWLWTAVGGAAAVALGVGLGVGLTRGHGDSGFDASLGTVGPKALVSW